jgi:2-dehydro-3-deoxy-L-rhamnonate dehydrogenase (NAD+)
MWRKVIEVNLVGTFLTCRAVVPHMLARGYGRIVNIASVAGKEGNPSASHYSASKAGVIGFTKSLGKELAKSNIMVNAVTPGAARTAIFDSMTKEHIEFMLSKIPMGRFLEVGEAAALIGWLCTQTVRSALARCSICRGDARRTEHQKVKSSRTSRCTYFRGTPDL